MASCQINAAANPITSIKREAILPFFTGHSKMASKSIATWAGTEPKIDRQRHFWAGTHVRPTVTFIQQRNGMLMKNLLMYRLQWHKAYPHLNSVISSRQLQCVKILRGVVWGVQGIFMLLGGAKAKILILMPRNR